MSRRRAERPKVLFLCPLYGRAPSLSAISFTALFTRTLADGIDADVHQSDMPYIDVNRNDCALYACESNATHALWLDHDMAIPSDAVSRLLAHDLDVVGGAYFKRAEPFDPVFWQWAEEQYQIRPYWGYEKGALQRVGGLGLGLALVRVDVMRAMREHFGDEAWFFQNLRQGEDVWFYDRLRQMEVPVWLDASIRCGHVGDMAIHEGHFEGYKRWGLKEGVLCLEHGWHESTPGRCPGCEGEEQGHGTSAA